MLGHGLAKDILSVMRRKLVSIMTPRRFSAEMLSDKYESESYKIFVIKHHSKNVIMLYLLLHTKHLAS